MRGTLAIALDLLREALARRWFLALGIAVTLVLVTIGSALKLEVVDGALAATRLFGTAMGGEIRPVDVALRPLFEATAYLIFYGGLVFGILACADFAPRLLTPGRIEHLLSLPIRRPELLAGTFLGVLLLASAFACYGAGGLTLLLGVKTGVWTLRPLAAAILAAVSFSALYAAMLATAVFVRSSALSAAVGGSLFVAGIVASYRDEVLVAFERGIAREIFALATLLPPRVAALADASAAIAGSQPIDLPLLGSLVAGLVAFAAGTLALAIWRFEGRDF